MSRRQELSRHVDFEDVVEISGSGNCCRYIMDKSIENMFKIERSTEHKNSKVSFFTNLIIVGRFVVRDVGPVCSHDGAQGHPLIADYFLLGPPPEYI